MERPKNKEEYRRQLSEMFAGILEEKGLEWKKEWRDLGGFAQQNGITRAHYRGCNALMLSLISMMKGYNDPRWLTMRQIADHDGKYHPKQKWHLKAGSKATYVEYWYPYDTKNKIAVTWDEYQTALADGRDANEFRMSTRYTPVFNACDIEGIPPMEAFRGPAKSPEEIVHKLSENMGVPIRYDGGGQAYYSPQFDEIHLPAPEAFESAYALNATALHELAHSTGHPTRLCRPISNAYANENYAYEELVAEISSCFMGAWLDTEPSQLHMDNHKAYVQSWIQGIREKPEALVRAIRDAQNAAGYMEWKAELISEQEYLKRKGKAMEVTVPKIPTREEVR